MNLLKKYNKLKRKLKKYKILSLTDDLTGLWNRRKLEQDLKRYLEIKKRAKINFLVMMIDLDNFKSVNDQWGHKEGDKYLQYVAKTLKDNVRKYEKVYRLSGDEFIIIFSHYEISPAMIEKKMQRILGDNYILASIGYSKLNKKTMETIDRRMYAEKRRHKNM